MHIAVFCIKITFIYKMLVYRMNSLIYFNQPAGKFACNHWLHRQFPLPNPDIIANCLCNDLLKINIQKVIYTPKLRCLTACLLLPNIMALFLKGYPSITAVFLRAMKVMFSQIQFSSCSRMKGSDLT